MIHASEGMWLSVCLSVCFCLYVCLCMLAFSGRLSRLRVARQQRGSRDPRWRHCWRHLQRQLADRDVTRRTRRVDGTTSSSPSSSRGWAGGAAAAVVAACLSRHAVDRWLWQLYASSQRRHWRQRTAASSAACLLDWTRHSEWRYLPPADTFLSV